MSRLALAVVLALTGVAIPGPDAPVKVVTATAGDGTLTLNYVHLDGHVTGRVILPDGGSFTFGE